MYNDLIVTWIFRLSARCLLDKWFLSLPRMINLNGVHPTALARSLWPPLNYTISPRSNISSWNVFFCNVYNPPNTISAFPSMCRKVSGNDRKKANQGERARLRHSHSIPRTLARTTSRENHIRRKKKRLPLLIESNSRWSNSVVRAWPWFVFVLAWGKDWLVVEYFGSRRFFLLRCSMPIDQCWQERGGKTQNKSIYKQRQEIRWHLLSAST